MIGVNSGVMGAMILCGNICGASIGMFFMVSNCMYFFFNAIHRGMEVYYIQSNELGPAPIHKNRQI